MIARLKSIFGSIFNVDPEERIKLLMLTVVYFLIIASYTVVQAMKDAIFLKVVGGEFLGYVKIASIFVLIPAILFYSYLVDRVRRYQLLYLYAIFYGVVGLIFAYYVGDPVIGIANTDTSKYRLFGWLFYFFIQGYSPFIVSLFWAFSNSVTDPKQAKDTYGLMVSGSKLGGALVALYGVYMFSNTQLSTTGVLEYQMLMSISFGLLLLVPIAVFILGKVVPKKHLHGYEAVYSVQKKEHKKKKSAGLFAGLKIMVKQPYVLGIFSMIFFYEVIHEVINYQRLIFANESGGHISALSATLFYQMFWVHFVGFLISLLGTNLLLRKLGEKNSIIFIPVFTGFLIILLMFNSIFNVVDAAVFIGFVYTALKSMNYAISYPVRESLYIPTVKDIKFKSKSWIDSFGSRFAKSFGGNFNILSGWLHSNIGLGVALFSQFVFFGVMISIWVASAIVLGKKYQKTIDNNEVIGVD
jgi:ATP:ADP antiporter, AAA family